MTALPCVSVPELALADDLFAGLYQHAKRVTVRARHRSIQPGPLLFRGASDQQLTVRVEVTEVIHTTLGAVSEDDARADGYVDVADMVHLMRRFYPDIVAESPVTLLRFTLTEPLTPEQAQRLAAIPPVPSTLV